MTPTKFQHAGLDWIPHTPGDPMPCPGDTLVRVLFKRELEEGNYQNFEFWAAFFSAEWGNNGGRSIIGWHPVEEQPSLARRVLDLLEAGNIEQAKHELRKELE
jgi:hypothetical protein